MVVKGHVTHERLLQVFTPGEPMGFEHIGDAPIETLDHAVGSGRAWFGQAMFNVQGLAELINLMVVRGLTFTAGKLPVGELLAVVVQYFLDLDWASLVQGFQKRASGSGLLVALDLNEYPARGSVNGHKQIAPAGLVRHLGQLFDIDVDESGLQLLRGLGCVMKAVSPSTCKRCLHSRHNAAPELQQFPSWSPFPQRWRA